MSQKQNQIEKLRELLSQKPSTRLFARVIEVLKQWESPGTIQLALDYAEEHLQSWPDAYRSIELGHYWPKLPKGKPPVYAGLVRGLLDSESTLSLSALKVLVQAPILENLTSLNLLHNTLQEKKLRLLMDSPHLVNIQELSLGLGKSAMSELSQEQDSPLLQSIQALTLHGSLTTKNVSLLAASPRMANLKKLVLESNNAQKNYKVTSITDSPCMSQLEELSIVICSKPGQSELASILQSPHLTKLTSLKLSAYCEFSEEDFTTMVTDPGMAKLTSLHIEYAKMEDDTLVDFANSPHLTKLTSLHLSDIRRVEYSEGLEENFEDSEGFKRLAHSPHLANLTSLKLSSNALTDQEVEAIANSPHMANLIELDLSKNPIGDDGVIAIANSPHMANLTNLSLGTTCVGNDGIKAIANSPYMANLSVLDLYGHFGDLEGDHTSKGLIDLANSPHMANLEVLNILHRVVNGFRSSQALFTSKHLKEQTRLGALEQLDTKPLQILAKKLALEGYKDMEKSELLEVVERNLRSS